VWAAERSGQVSVRNAKSGLIKSYLDQAGGSNFFIWCMTSTDHDVWMGTESGPIRIYSRARQAYVAEVRAHAGGVYCLVTNIERSRMYSGSNDFTTREWDVARRESLRLFAGHSNGVRCALCVGQHLWTGSDDTTIKVWDLISGVCIDTLTAHKESISSLVSSGKHIWSASADRTIRIWTITPSDKTISADKTIRTVTLDDAAAGSRAAGGGEAAVGAAGGWVADGGVGSGRKCIKVIARQEATWRPGCLVPMGLHQWAATGKEISTFDPRRQACVGTLSPGLF